MVPRPPLVALFASLVVSLAPLRVVWAKPQEDSPLDPRLVLMVSEFQANWQRAWRDSEDYRRMRMPYNDFNERHVYVYCYEEMYRDRSPSNPVVQGFGVAPPQYVLIRSKRPSRSWCPSWSLAKSNLDVDDESAWRDGALRPSLRASVATQRDSLVVALAAALAKDSSSGWIAGQLVRFRVDARDFDAALQAASRCRALAWWCAGLSGYAHAKNNETLAADSAFGRMRAAMPDSLRCAWEDASLLLRTDQLTAYRKFNCRARDSVNAQIWWLADPLFREAGNARWVEQEVRRMDIALRKSVTQDERFSFDEQRGGDAVAEVLARYGWPSYTAWHGVAKDRNISYQSLEINRNASPPSPPYTSLEYAPGRISSIPEWRAVAFPYTATATDWALGGTDSSGAPNTSWWSQEHFWPGYRIVPLPKGQTVTVRRQSHVDVVAALELAHPAQLRRDATYDVLLLSTTAPGNVDSISRGATRSGGAIRLRGPIKSNPTVLAIEAVEQPARELAARTRFGFTPPPPLSAILENEIAVSDIAVLTPRTPSELEAPTDSLLQHLYPRLSLSSRERRITLYWESYGTQPRDSASIVLRVVPANDPGFLQRVGTAVGMVTDPTRGIEVRFRDQDARTGKTTLVGPVPAQMRALSLDLAALKPGRYTLDISMSLRDGRAASRQTVVELLP